MATLPWKTHTRTRTHAHIQIHAGNCWGWQKYATPTAHHTRPLSRRPIMFMHEHRRWSATQNSIFFALLCRSLKRPCNSSSSNNIKQQQTAAAACNNSSGNSDNYAAPQSRHVARCVCLISMQYFSRRWCASQQNDERRGGGGGVVGLCGVTYACVVNVSSDANGAVAVDCCSFVSK